MTFKARIYRKWVRRLALGLALAAIVAPSAQAIDPAVANGDYSPGNLVTAPQVTIPEGWGDAQFGPANFVTAPRVTILEGWGDAQFGPANFVTVPSASPTPAAPASTPGFDWADAGIGAAIALGAALLAAAGLMFGRRRGRFASA